MNGLGLALVEDHARTLLDEDQRPVAEVGSVHWATTPTELVACPYAGVRRGRPMNVSALHQLGAVWPALVATAGALSGPEHTVHSAFRAALVGTALPVAWDLARPGAPVPRVLSGLYKTSLGMSQSLATLLLAADGVADAPLSELGDRGAFLDWLEGVGLLAGDLQACAGPPAMIGQLFAAMAGAPPEGPLDPEVAALEPERVAPIALEIAGRQALAVLAATADRRAGRARTPTELPVDDWLSGRGPAWLRAVPAVPGRAPAHVRRLFPAGKLPAVVARELARRAD